MTASSLIDCRACSKPISPNANICPSCGEPTEQRGLKRAVIAVAVFCGALIAFVIFAFVMAQNDQAAQDKQSQTLQRHFTKP